jgi:hypothetical protein
MWKYSYFHLDICAQAIGTVIAKVCQARFSQDLRTTIFWQWLVGISPSPELDTFKKSVIVEETSNNKEY